MKKAFFIVTLSLLTYSTNFATVVILGKAENIEQSGGTTYIQCKGTEGVCVTIGQAPHFTDNKIVVIVNTRGSEHIRFVATEYARQDHVDGNGKLVKELTFNNTQNN